MQPQRSIESRIKIRGKPYEELLCPICKLPVPHYEPILLLEIDFDDVARKIDSITKRWPSHSGDVVKIILLIDQQGDTIFGHPVEYRVVDK